VSPARARVLEVIRTAGRPVGVDEIAAAAGLGLNAARHHLAALDADGFVSAAVDRAGKRGRPRLVFTPGPGPGGPYERLALALLHARRTGVSVEAAGRAVAPPGDDVVAFLAAEGFDPHPAEDGGVVLAACPLASGAELDPGVVCGVHRGLVAAVGERRGEDVTLVVGRPGTCRVVFAEAPAEPG
jgi:predicted ArsR family transcriptional regulator